MARHYLLVLVALIFMSGCQQSAPPTSTHVASPSATTPSTTEQSSSSTTFPLTFKDSLQREVTLPKLPQRIISIAPKNTDMLFSIGAGPQVVGVTTFCNYPPEAAKVDKIGGFSGKSLNLEKIVSLQPDLIVCTGEMHQGIMDEFDRLGLKSMALDANSFADMFAELQLLGRVTGHEREATALVAQLQQRVERIRDTAAKIPADERVKLYYQLWGDPVMAGGPKSYFGEMIEICGGKNIIDDTSTRFPKPSLEFILAADPDLIIGSTMQQDFFANGVKDRPGWKSLRAVQNDKVYLLDTDTLSRCSPHLVDGLELMAHTLYPKYFPAPPAPAGVAPTSTAAESEAKP